MKPLSVFAAGVLALLATFAMVPSAQAGTAYYGWDKDPELALTKADLKAAEFALRHKSCIASSARVATMKQDPKTELWEARATVRNHRDHCPSNSPTVLKDIIRTAKEVLDLRAKAQTVASAR